MANKYNAVKQTIDGYTFDSRVEAHRYTELLLAREAGIIRSLSVHPVFELQPAFVDSSGKKQRAINYEADFVYIEDGKQIVEDIKGFATQAFKLKAKMFMYRYPKLELRIIK